MNLKSDPNEQSWEKCFDELAPRLVLYARQLTPSMADAEDVVQMAFVRWWRRFPQADADHIPLLYAAVRTIALDQRRGERRRTAREQRSPVVEAHRRPGYFDATAEQQDVARVVEASLEGLPTEQREVVTLHVWSGLTFAQIAEALGASINTVAARYRYALKALERKLSPLREELMEPAIEPELPAFATPQNH
ncbi:MAG: RNA polymerase sigma factor [Verrucomicrobiales bacterium]|nr:RNA polymerase sigma factor [Verrucomicrobiales bacterium]